MINAEMVLSMPSVTTSPRNEDECRLVELARGGDQPACELLAVRYRVVAYRVALQILRNREDAMDIAQEAILRFFTSINRFRADKPVKPWVVRIAHNLSVDVIRKRRTRKNVPYRRNDEGLLIEPPDRKPGAQVIIEKNELKQRVWDAVNSLDEIHREIVILRDYNDLSYSDIAETLKIPIGTVMSRLHKARRLLSVLLSGEISSGREESKEQTPENVRKFRKQGGDHE